MLKKYLITVIVLIFAGLDVFADNNGLIGYKVEQSFLPEPGTTISFNGSGVFGEYDFEEQEKLNCSEMYMECSRGTTYIEINYLSYSRWYKSKLNQIEVFKPRIGAVPVNTDRGLSFDEWKQRKWKVLLPVYAEFNFINFEFDSSDWCWNPELNFGAELSYYPNGQVCFGISGLGRFSVKNAATAVLEKCFSVGDGISGDIESAKFQASVFAKVFIW